MLIILFLLKNEANPKARKSKAGDRVRVTKHKSVFSGSYTEELVKGNIYYPFRVRVENLAMDL